jgi:hypothetical protein
MNDVELDRGEPARRFADHEADPVVLSFESAVVQRFPVCQRRGWNSSTRFPAGSINRI